MTRVIEFFDKSSSTHFLNNRSPVIYEGMTYPTLWHGLAASRTPLEADKRLIAKATDTEIGTLLRDWKAPLDEDAELKVMNDLLCIKFGVEIQRKTHLEQIKNFRNLIETGDARLEFGNYDHRTFWGKCHCFAHTDPKYPALGTGDNHLGKLIMAIRSELRDQIEEVNAISVDCTCGKPAVSYLLYFTDIHGPFQPRVWETCDACESKTWESVTAIAVDHVASKYNPDLPSETSIILANPAAVADEEAIVVFGSHQVRCPICRAYNHKGAFFCGQCHNRLPAPLTPVSRVTDDQEWQSAWEEWDKSGRSSISTERKYASKVIKC